MKRTRQQNKTFKQIIKNLDEMLGEQDSGVLLSLLHNLLINIGEQSNSERITIRSLELTINDFYSTKFNFESGEFE